MDSQLRSNPFTQRGAIRDPARFFGRQMELHRIFDCIGKMQSVSVVGERRIGKSSLLHYVSQTGQPYVLAGARLLYLDVQRVQDEKDFYTRLLETLGGSGKTFRDLERGLQRKQVVVCLDEFEQVAGNDTFSEGFFNGLRSLAQDGLALVTATQHSLFDLCRDKQFAGSEFWNIFQRQDLGLFTEVDARQCIRTGFADVDVRITEREMFRLLQLAGRFPFFLQLACSCLFQEKMRQTSQWERTFAREARDYLVALWECRTAPEQAALKWVVGLGTSIPDDQLLENLEQRGLLVCSDRKRDDWRIFAEAFEDVVRNPPKKRRQWQWLYFKRP